MMHGETNGHAINGNGHVKNGRTHVNGNGGNRVAGLMLPPQNIEAEEGVIGSILLDNSVYRDVAPILTPDRFYRDVHQILYAAVVALATAGSPVDMITVRAYLEARGQLDKIGGIDAILSILNAVPHAANARYYAQIVRQLAVKRDLIQAAQQILNDGYSATSTAEELLASTLERVGRVQAAEAVDFADDDAVEVATVASVRNLVTESRWLWPHWIIDAQLTVLAAEPAAGKTRLTLDLCRRMWHCEPWPDGCLATRPMRTASFWVCADRNHGEIVHAAEAFGLPDEAVYFNATPTEPFGGIKLDDPSEIRAMRRRIKACRPGLVVIDTINKATRLALYRPEDAERFFGPLLDVARDLQVPILALTHLAKSGDALDRRIHGTARVMIKMAKPEGDEITTRRRLWVAEIREGRPPAALGVEMGDAGNEYNGNPPSLAAPPSASKGAAGKTPSAVRAAMDWLSAKLAEGPIFCRAAIADAVEAGHGKRTFFKAVKELGVVTEGPKGNRFYRLPKPGEESEGEDDDEFDE